MSRAVSGTLVLALVALLAPAALSWVAYRGVRDALQGEFEQRLVGLASATASQITAEDVADVHLFGDEGAGYGQLQVQLEELKATNALANASVFDTARTRLYDCSGPGLTGESTPLDSLARSAVDAALAGRPAVSGLYAGPGGALRAGLAPVLGAGRVAGAVAVEATVGYLPVLDRFRRTLLLALATIAAGVVALAVLRIRVALASERLERRLARAETLAAMGRLTATLAHEIKNPLAIIRGSAQRLGRLEPEAGRMAGFIVEESDRLSRTVARYLQFSRPDEGPGGAGDAIAALDQTLALLEGEAGARRIAIERTGERGPGPVRLDNESLKQIYLNLVLNGMEAMPDGGTLRVEARCGPREVEVSIADEGPGIPPEHLTQLGSAFWTTKAQGSGLGLFLSRRLARTGGGELELRNAGTRGAIGTLRLPRRKEEAT